MLFEVSHLTRYRYEEPVVLGPHLVRLRPRCDLSQRVVAHSLTFDPPPQGVTESMDADANAVTLAWFSGRTPSLTIRAACTVETLRPNPFDYVVLEPEAMVLPMTYRERERRALAQYLGDGAAEADPAVRGLAADALAAAAGGPTTFLVELCSRIGSAVRQVVRPDGNALAPERTLAMGEGACRDLAVLFIACCRVVGIAARFVTGYETGDPAGERELHAWAEVYLRGAGWRGWDPSQGLAVADGHVAVAAAATPEAAAATEGTFSGAGGTSTLETHINLRVPAMNGRRSSQTP